VVDDDANARVALGELLRDQGFEVEIAADACKALDKYEAFAPHAVITNVKLPGMGGIELLEKLRAAEDPAAVIVMTTFGDVATAVEAMRAGAADYLTKPLNLDELLVVLGKVVSIQEHEFERVGGTQTIRVDIRIIAATHLNLLKEIAKGRFRQDLYYRLNVVSIEIPALRERQSDIPSLVALFIDRYARENGKSIEGCTPATLDLLMRYHWPRPHRIRAEVLRYDFAAVEIAIFFDCAPAFLGTARVSTPSLSSVFACSRSAPSGSVKLRLKLPY
jgi:DNA-binding NtrC family response regulator